MTGTHPDRADRQPGGRLRQLTGWKGALVSLAFGAFLFGLLELALALIGFTPGIHDEDPFVGFASNVPLFVEASEPRDGGYLETAPYKRRFFNQQRFALDKRPGTYRIFCLGGSTTYGRPYDDGTSFPGWLRELLPAADASREWEVVNAGGISYASYRVARLMRELTEYRPDLFIIYSGHNEFLEERSYGKLRELPAAVRWTAGVLSRTRSWSAVGALLTRTGASQTTAAERPLLKQEVDTRLEHSAGPELYQRDDELTEQILAHYRFNLKRMIRMGRAAGAEVVLVSPASNLKDCSPFKSERSPGLAEPEAERATALLEAALDDLDGSRPDQALARLDQAIAIDPRFAELHFRRGQALAALGRHDDALTAFTLARDEDVCPLRALTSLRQALQAVARDTATPLVDFRDVLEEQARISLGKSPHGADYFLDHVHPTIEGNRLLALALVDLLAERGVIDLEPGWGPATVAAVARRVEAGIDQRQHARALANLAVVLSWAGKAADARRLGLEALGSEAADPTTTTLVAQTLARQEARAGNHEQALDHYRRALAANPLNPETHLQLGLLLVSRQRLEAAAAHLFLTSVIWPANPEGHRQLGFVMAARGRSEVALASLQKAAEIEPGRRLTEAKIAQLRQRLAADTVEPFKLSLAKYPSGSPRRLTQARPSPNGYVADGIWTEWHENGLPARFVDYRAGVPHGVEVVWDSDGRRLDRIEHSPPPQEGSRGRESP